MVGTSTELGTGSGTSRRAGGTAVAPTPAELRAAVRLRAPRTLHILDIENLLEGVVTSARVTEFWKQYARLAPVGEDDLVVVGCARRVAMSVLFSLPRRFSVVLGEDVKDGADVALLRAVDPVHQAKRFDRVVIGSGDGAFEPMAWMFREGGCRTELVTVSTAAVGLQRACHSSVRMPGWSLPDERRLWWRRDQRTGLVPAC